MQFLIVALVSGLIAFVLPFLFTYAPYFAFKLYAGDLGTPEVSTHIQASADSLFALASAATCLASPLSFIPFACPEPREATVNGDGDTLRQRGDSHRVLVDQLVLHAPSILDILSTLRSLQYLHAAHDVDNANVLNISRNLANSLRTTIIHIEITVAGVVFTDMTISTALSLLDACLSHVPCAKVPTALQFDRIAAVSAAATSDSVNRTLAEVDHALALVDILSTTIYAPPGPTEFNRGSASVIRANQSPAYLYARESDHQHLTWFTEELRALRETLRDGDETLHHGDGGETVPLPHQVLRVLIEAHIDVHRRRLEFLWRLRVVANRLRETRDIGDRPDRWAF